MSALSTVTASSKLRHWPSLLLLVLLPFCLRAHGIEHGLPRNYVPDTHIVRNALGMGQNKNLVPRAGEYSQYPNLLPYCLLPLYAAWYAEGRLSGRWQSTADFGIHLQLHPEGAHALARWLILLFGVLTPLLVFAIARETGLRRGAWVAGLLAGTSLLAVQLSTHERPWVPLTFFLALSALGVLRQLERSSWRAWYLSVAGAALAFATHPAGLFGLGLPALGWLCAGAGWKGPGSRSRWRAAGAGAPLFLLLAFVIGYPHLLVHGRTPAAATIGGSQADLSIGGMSAELRFTTASFLRLTRVFFGYEPILVLLGLPGLIWALRRRATRVLMFWTALWSGYFLFNVSDHARYLLPLAMMLCLPAGWAAERLLERRAGRALVVLALAIALVQALRLAHLLAQTDTRSLAEQRLAQLPPGARVALDRYGPEVDLSSTALEVLASLRAEMGATLSGRESVRRAALAAGRTDLVASGLDALPMAELFAFDERARTCTPWPVFDSEQAAPLSLLRKYGVTHLLVVDRRLAAGRGSMLHEWVAHQRPLWSIDPSTRETAREAFLPTEMDFPLTALWRIDRPGPRMSLYELVP